MPRPQRHVFVCSQQRPPGHPRGSCAQRGAQPVLQAFWAELQRRQAFAEVAVTYSGCLGPCDGGPSVVVYPDGVMYQRVTPEDVSEIFEQHLIGGAPVTRLVADAAAW